MCGRMDVWGFLLLLSCCALVSGLLRPFPSRPLAPRPFPLRPFPSSPFPPRSTLSISPTFAPQKFPPPTPPQPTPLTPPCPPQAIASCHGFEQINSSCRCFCPVSAVKNCNSGETLDPDRCECRCLQSSSSCNRLQTFDPDNCVCRCRLVVIEERIAVDLPVRDSDTRTPEGRLRRGTGRGTSTGRVATFLASLEHTRLFSLDELFIREKCKNFSHRYSSSNNHRHGASSNSNTYR